MKDKHRTHKCKIEYNLWIRFTVKITLLATYYVIHWNRKQISILSINKLSIDSITIIFLFESRTFSNSMIKHIFFNSRNIVDFDLRLNHELFEIRVSNKHSLFYNVRIFFFEKCIDEFIYQFSFIKVFV